ncbi:MAG: hypothetical protein K8R67_16755 [Desulfobacteraceae bacterium]|nr:hypothetical protein [Desulfobacteraceae bacterium]
MNNKLLIILVAILVIPFLELTQVSASGNKNIPDPELQVTNAENSIQENEDIETMMENYLNDNGWNQGKNRKKNGGEFHVSMGTGIIQAPRTSKMYLDSRSNAFDKALLEAKKEMLMYIGSAISQETTLKSASDYSEGAVVEEETVQFEKSLINKGKMLLNAELDELLKAKGIDPHSQEAQKEIPKIIESEKFQKSVRAVSQSFLAGIQANSVFEKCSEGEKGEIGVITVWSEKLNQMAVSISTGEKLNIGKAKNTIAEQVADTSQLINTFGVKQTRDENGKYVLLAFGQSGMKGKSKMAKKSAKRVARLQADSYLRMFAGENTCRSGAMDNSEDTQALEDETQPFKAEATSEEFFKSTSASMNISGIYIVKNWSAKHPLVGSTIYGTVIAWSPDASASAKKMKQKIKTPTTSSASGSGSGNTEISDSAGTGKQKGSYQGKGIDSDEDDF